MPLLRVGVSMPPFVPFTLVEHLGQNQRRLDRVKRLAFVKHFVICVRASAKKIGDHSTGAHFGDDPRSEAISGAVDGDQLNFRELLPKLVEQWLGAVAANVEV